MKKHIALSASALVLVSALAGCAKKTVQAPPPPPPPPPPVVETVTPPPPPPPPVVEAPKVDTNALRRQRLNGLMGEVLKPIYFDYDQSEVRPEGKDILKKIGDLLKTYPELFVTVEGNTDERGSTEYNLALGERRAKAAFSWLKNYGVKDSQLKSISYGKERPAVQGSDESAWSQNRRDEFPGEVK